MFGLFRQPGAQPTNPQPVNPNPWGVFAPSQPAFNPGQPGIASYYGDHLKQVVDGLYQLELDSSLQNLLFLLKMQQEQAIETMQKAKNTDYANKSWDLQGNREEVEYVRDRCSKIKKRNTSILIKMMNLREKMAGQMYMFKIPSKSKEIQLSQITERIRDTKYHISLKYNKLKLLRMNREKEDVYQTKKKTESTLANYPLLELRKGTEILQKEALKLKEEFSLFQRFAHGENIL